MRPGGRNNLWLGALGAGFALLLLMWLIPLDTDTGLFETVRRRVVIGDALAPSLAAVFILTGGLMLMLVERRAAHQPGIPRHVWRFLALLLGVLIAGFMVVRHAGPLTVSLTGGEYRPLRDTAPWKHIGFALGGIGIVSGLIMLIEHRFSARALLIGIGVVLALIALFDLPFSDLLVPPNGDV